MIEFLKSRRKKQHEVAEVNASNQSTAEKIVSFWQIYFWMFQIESHKILLSSHNGQTGGVIDGSKSDDVFIIHYKLYSRIMICVCTQIKIYRT